MTGWGLPSDEHIGSWTKRRLGDTPPACFVLNPYVDVDRSGQWLAFSVSRSLGATGHSETVQLPSISWYAIVDVSAGKLAATGPHSQEPKQQVQDRVIGWSSSHLIVKRSRLIHAGAARLSGAGQPVQVADDEVSILLVSHNGQERVLHSFVCRSDARLPLPPPCSEYMLGHFTLCRNGDCLVFTRFVPAFREQPHPVLPQRRMIALDETKCRDAIHVVRLTTGRAQMLCETPAGWGCEDVWFDCSSGKVQAIVSSARDGNKVLGVAVKAAQTPATLKLLRTFKKAFWGEISPDGSAIAFVNGSGSQDTSTVQILRPASRPNLPRRIVIPGWRRKITWSRDSRQFALWYSVWFHDKLGRKYQRLYQGYRIWVVDATSGDARAVGPEWSGDIALAWSRRNEGLFIIANGTLGYMDVKTGHLRRIWEFPQEWREAAE